MQGWVIGLAAGVALGVGVQQLRVGALQTDLAQADAAQKTLAANLATSKADALEQARKKDSVIANQQKALNETIAQSAQDSADWAQKYEVAVAGVRAADERLRHANAALRERHAGAGDAADNLAAIAAELEAARQTIGVLTRLRDGSASRAVERSRFADKAWQAAVSCERDYNAARAAVQHAEERPS